HSVGRRLMRGATAHARAGAVVAEGLASIRATHYDRTHVRVRVRVRGVAGHAAMAGQSRRPMTAYAELHAHSAFSFLDGVSQPEELVAEAARLGLSAISITDHDGLYGVVRFAEA